jgi:hypothetical protein
MINNNCIINKHHKFLWWQWDSEDENHIFVYIDKDHRVCKKCGLKQILYRVYMEETGRFEDWREYSPDILESK